MDTLSPPGMGMVVSPPPAHPKMESSKSSKSCWGGYDNNPLALVRMGDEKTLPGRCVSAREQNVIKHKTQFYETMQTLSLDLAERCYYCSALPFIIMLTEKKKYREWIRLEYNIT